ncbi:MAG: pH regulation protein F [Spirochaetales bacterium]|nr:pH regulation protein F [Spirochaetales bacterium]
MIMTISLALIGLAALLTIVRLLRGPTSFDRLVASDVLAIVSTAFLAVYSVMADSSFFMDVAIVNVILGFIGVVMIARFLMGVMK